MRLRLWPTRRGPSAEACDAQYEATRARVDAEATSAKADILSGQLAHLRRENHFAEAIIKAIRGT